MSGGHRKPTFQKGADHIARAFRGEARDEAWAARAEQALSESTDDPAFGGADLVQHECRATICRAVIRFGTANARLGFTRLINLEPWTNGGVLRPLGSVESNRVEVFIARKGTNLPSAKVAQ